MPTLSTEQRRARIVEKLRLDQPGIEYGPLNRPIVSREHKVRYVDHAPRNMIEQTYSKSKGESDRNLFAT